MRLVSQDEARRIAVRAQLLDGSATTILDTVRRLGFLQIDPISTVAPPQQLVLWSRLGLYDRAELDRLLWETKELFEWNAYVWPIEDLPLVRARMRRRRGKYTHERRSDEFLQTNRRFREFVLRELEQKGPMLSREIEGDAVRTWESHGWYGNRSVAVMLEILHGRGVVAVAGRRNGSGSGTSPSAGIRRRRRSRCATRTGSSRTGASARSACGSRRAAGRRTRRSQTVPCRIA